MAPLLAVHLPPKSGTKGPLYWDGFPEERPVDLHFTLLDSLLGTDNPHPALCLPVNTGTAALACILAQCSVVTMATNTPELVVCLPNLRSVVDPDARRTVLQQCRTTAEYIGWWQRACPSTLSAT